LPVWLFSSGPTGSGDPEALLKGWRFPESLKPVADQIKPVDIAVFHGRLVMDELFWLHRKMVRMVNAPAGDFRDWNAIDAWANGIARFLREKE